MAGDIVLAEKTEAWEVPLLLEPGPPANPAVVGDDEDMLLEADLLGVVNSAATLVLKVVDEDESSSPVGVGSCV